MSDAPKNQLRGAMIGLSIVAIIAALIAIVVSLRTDEPWPALAVAIFLPLFVVLGLTLSNAATTSTPVKKDDKPSG
ncbi:MAG: hypothetical protein AAGJ87_05535 [Pseudomonadota bacterium]